MLTDNDLQKLGKLLDDRLDEKLENKFEAKFSGFEKKLRNTFEVLEGKLKENLDEKLEEKFKQKLDPINKKLRKITKNQDAMLDMLNADDMRLQKRVKRIEDHLHLPPLKDA